MGANRLMEGLSSRKIGATSINSKSSRSHIIFTCVFESWCKETPANNFSSSKTSRISLVDLAGLGRNKQADAGREFERERKELNSSLSHLGRLSSSLDAVKSAIQQCCNQLKSKIVKRIQAREQEERKNMSKYIPSAANAIFEVLSEASQFQASKKRKYEGEDAEVLRKVATRALTAETLKEKLAKHVEQMLL